MDICNKCKKQAEIYCSCNEALLYCYSNFRNYHLNTKGKHYENDIATRR